jgi:opacity protein-like surface antigen
MRCEETSMKKLLLAAALIAGTCALTASYTPAMAQASGGGGAGASGAGGAGAGSDVTPPGSKPGPQKMVKKKKKKMH